MGPRSRRRQRMSGRTCKGAPSSAIRFRRVDAGALEKFVARASQFRAGARSRSAGIIKPLRTRLPTSQRKAPRRGASISEQAEAQYKRAAEVASDRMDTATALDAQIGLLGANALNRPAEAAALVRLALAKYPEQPMLVGRLSPNAGAIARGRDRSRAARPSHRDAGRSSGEARCRDLPLGHGLSEQEPVAGDVGQAPRRGCRRASMAHSSSSPIMSRRSSTSRLCSGSRQSASSRILRAPRRSSPKPIGLQRWRRNYRESSVNKTTEPPLDDCL